MEELNKNKTNILNSNLPNFIQILYGLSTNIVSSQEISTLLTNRTRQLNKPLLHIKPCESPSDEKTSKDDQQSFHEDKRTQSSIQTIVEETTQDTPEILSQQFAKLDTTWKERENGKFVPSKFQKGILNHIQKQREICGHKIGLMVLATYVVDLFW